MMTNKEIYGSPDEQLWKSFREGHKDALSSIFLNNYDRLFSYASRLVPSSDEAKDLIQDLFLKLWNNRDNLGKCGNIRYYLLQSVRRLVIDQYQKKKRPLNTELNENLIPSEPPFESVLIFNQDQANLRKELKKAYNQLSKRQQEAIYLRFFQQIDYPVIAEIMAVNVQSVRNLIHTAIQQLKQQLGNSFIFFIALLKKK